MKTTDFRATNLRATDLMVGDWLYAIDDNGETHPCRVNNLEYDYTNKRDEFSLDFYGTGFKPVWPDVAFFKVGPIPITPEILEKNGWKHDPSVSAVMTKSSYSPSNVISRSWDSRSHELHMAIRNECKLREINIPCDYVHELQHALKLCGIEKEIVL